MLTEGFVANIISIFLLLTTIVSTCFAIYYKKKEYKAVVDHTIQVSGKLTVYTTREKMLEHLHAMYAEAKAGEIIWGQSVSGNIYGDVSGPIATAAARGVKFQMIFTADIDQPSNRKRDLKQLFTILNGAVVIRKDNDVRIQGLSDREAVIALPGSAKYIAILIKDEAVVRALRFWFLSRFEQEEP